MVLTEAIDGEVLVVVKQDEKLYLQVQDCSPPAYRKLPSDKTLSLEVVGGSEYILFNDPEFGISFGKVEEKEGECGTLIGGVSLQSVLVPGVSFRITFH